LELTNVARDDPGKLEESDDEAGNTEQSLKLLNNTFSIDERIELLMRTFTQELFKKIQMAVFEEDRKLITYMLVTRVMESESFIDRNLFDFLISGARSVSAATQVPEELDRLPWLNSMVWADLKYLSTLKPFKRPTSSVTSRGSRRAGTTSSASETGHSPSRICPTRSS